jgi:hypothetical protein
MKLEYKEGLIFTSIKISFNGKSKIINNIVINTALMQSIISSKVVGDIGINSDSSNAFENNKNTLFTKVIDKITLGCNSIEKISVDFDLIDNELEINGLLGLDILIKFGAVIDLKNLELKFN